MLVTVTVWAAFALSIRGVASSSLTQGDLAVLRFTIPALVLLPWLPRTIRKCRTAPLPALPVIALGAGLPHLLVSEAGGAMTTAPLVGLVIPGTVPLFVSIFARKRLSKAKIAALGLIITGVAVTLLFGPNGAPAGGVAFLLAAGALWSAYTVALRRLDLEPVEVAVLISGISMPFAIAASLLDSNILRGNATLHDIVTFGLIQGIAVGVLSTLCYSFAVRRIGSATAATLGALSPGLTAILAIPLFGEIPDGPMTVSLVLIVAGVIALNAPIRVPEAPAGGDPVPDQPLELGEIREPALLLARPEQVTVQPDVEDPACPGDQRDLAELDGEGGQQFLCGPPRTQ